MYSMYDDDVSRSPGAHEWQCFTEIDHSYLSPKAFLRYMNFPFHRHIFSRLMIRQEGKMPCKIYVEL